MPESKIEVLARLNGLLAEARTLAGTLGVPEPEPVAAPEPKPRPAFNGDPFNLRGTVTDAMIFELRRQLNKDEGSVKEFVNALLDLRQSSIVYGGDAIVVTIPTWMRGNDV